MTRVIHTGDTHLGYQQYHVPERAADFLDAFRQVAADAVADDVDAVVHAGDLFHDRRPTLDDIMGALSVLRTLDDAGVPFLAIVGNHEAKREAQWLDLYESLGLATRLDAEPVTVGNTAFYGLDFVPRSKREGLEYDFAAHDADYAALVSHGLFEPFPHGDWDAREVLAAADVRFDAMLLGDDHASQTKQIAEPHEAWLTYCGSTERASAAERDDRGYNLVNFDAETGVDVRRRGLDTREFVFVDVELAEGEGVERVRERVGQYALTEAVVVVTISGEGEPVAPAAIEEYGDERGALVTRVTDHREVAAEAEELEVSFADPDAAVQERIRELGLSPAARDLDETIRASKIPDSNVTAAVEAHVRDLVDEAEPSAFEPAADETAAAGAESGEQVPADGAADEVAADAAEDSTADPDVVTGSGGEPADDDTASAPADDPDSEQGEEPDPGDPDESDGEPTERPDAREADAPDDEPAEETGDDGEDAAAQASMEEYL